MLPSLSLWPPGKQVSFHAVGLRSLPYCVSIWPQLASCYLQERHLKDEGGLQHLPLLWSDSCDNGQKEEDAWLHRWSKSRTGSLQRIYLPVTELWEVQIHYCVSQDVSQKGSIAVIQSYINKRFAFLRKRFCFLFYFLKKDVPYVLFLHTSSTEISWGRLPQSGMF